VLSLVALLFKSRPFLPLASSAKKAERAVLFFSLPTKLHHLCDQLPFTLYKHNFESTKQSYFEAEFNILLFLNG
jgi:hypothetical protein